MKKTAAFIYALLSVCASYAQIQPGYVTVLERLGKTGDPLSGVTIRVKGGHNAVLSKEDGTFSLLMAGKRIGDVYALQQVSKTGYVLLESDVIGRPYAFSDKVPLTLAMISSAQLEEDKLQNEKKSYQNAEKNYKTQLARLEEQKEKDSLTIEQYRQELQSLQHKFEKNLSLFSSLAEHYARDNYRILDETDREINRCIENGELERADSLIHALFNPLDVLKRNTESLSRIDPNDADAEAVLKQRGKYAEYLYHLYAIALMRFDNVKAAQYIETRAELDTTNVQWQLEAGLFVSDYLADYTKAMEYNQRALRHAIAQWGEQHPDVATSYNNIGLIFNVQSNFTQALEYYQKALKIRLAVLEEQHPDVATSYNNIGMVFNSQGNYTKALEYLQKALKIWLAVLGEQHPAVALSYNNIGTVFDSQGNYTKALEYYQKALKIQLAVFGEQHPSVALCYNNIGFVFHSQGKYDKALEYYQKALKILLAVFDEQHPNVALSYNNIGNVFNSQGNYTKALEYFQKALKIQLAVFGEQHSSVALSYNNIGFVFNSQGDYPQALEYFQKALKIQLAIFGEQHPDVATSYHNIGSVFGSQGDYPKALEYYQKALKIWLAVFGEQHPNVAFVYSNIGFSYITQEDYPQAIVNLKKALSIYSTLYGYDNNQAQATYTVIYLSFCQSLLQSDELKPDFEQFMSEYVYTITFTGETGTGSSDGLNGEYYLFELGDWQADDTKNVYVQVETLQNSPHDVVIMKDETVTTKHRENMDGCTVMLKHVTPQEKQRITAAYQRWKKERHQD